MSVFLSTMNQVLANGLETIIYLAGSNHMVSQSFAQCQSDSTNNAGRDVTIHIGVPALPLVGSGHEVVVECRNVKEGLEGGVKIARVAHVEHASTRPAIVCVTHLHRTHREERNLKYPHAKHTLFSMTLALTYLGFGQGSWDLLTGFTIRAIS